MKFQYDVAIDGTKARVWVLLSDIPRAAKMIPGVQSVNLQVDGTYRITMRIRVGAIGFNLAGIVSVEEDEQAGKWNVRAEARDPRVGGGVVSVVETIVSEFAQGTTEIHVDADTQFSGRLGQLGQPLAMRKVDALFKEFIGNLKMAVADVP